MFQMIHFNITHPLFQKSTEKNKTDTGLKTVSLKAWKVLFMAWFKQIM